jgi:hypothetical protein
MKNALFNVILLAPLLTAGCASIVDGHDQSLPVKTVASGNDLAGAQCELKNDKGVWYVATPGSVTVHRSYDKLNVTCKETGYTANVVAVDSSTKGMAFGNILFGGLIGAGVDMSTGAAYDYPALITVPMEVVPSNAAPSTAPVAGVAKPVS